MLLLLLLLCAATVAWLLASGPDPTSLRVADPPQPAAPPKPALALDLRGVTVDDAGRLLPGVEVDCPAATTRTDAVGSFSCVIKSLPATIDARALGRATTPPPALAHVKTATPGLLRLRLRRPGTLRGVVLDGTTGPGGAPRTDVAMRIHWLQADRLDGAATTPFFAARLERSQADGSFRLGGVWPGRLRLQATLGDPNDPAASAWSEPIDLRDGETVDGIVLRIGPGGSLRASVRSADGAPIAGALLRIDEVQGGPEARSDPDGAVLLRNLPAGTWSFAVEADGYARSRERVTITADGASKHAFVLQLRPRYAVRVLDAEGVPVLGADVQARIDGARPQAGPEGAVATTPAGEARYDLHTSADGRAALAAEVTAKVPPGAIVYATAFHPAHGRAAEGVVEPGVEAELRLPAAGGLRGIVVDRAGRPVTTAVLWCEPSATGPTAWGRTLAPRPARVDGTFALQPLPAGRYDLRARAVGQPPGVLRGVVVDSGAVREGLVLRLDGGADLHGRVDDATGAPAAGAIMQLRCGDDDPLEVAAADDGAYRFPEATPGACSLTVAAEGHLLEVRRLHLPDSGPQRLDLRLRPVGAGRVHMLPRHGLALSEGPEGMVIAEVRPGSPAARAGLEVGDRVVSIDFRRLGPHTFDEVAAGAKAGADAALTFEIGSGSAAETVYVAPEPGPASAKGAQETP